MRNLKIAFTSTLALFLCFNAMAQQADKDSLTADVKEIKNDLKGLKKIKFTGFIQAQGQAVQTAGATAAAAGGNFASTNNLLLYDSRFQLRRARLKAAYSGENSTVAIQLDLKDDGSVRAKEAYGIYSEPYLKMFSLTAGLFNRPIGFEVEYAMSAFESPERSRIIQSLFPDECDLGGKLTIQSPKTSPFNFIKLDVGLFTGNAINVETDKYKDIIAHLTMKKDLLNEKVTISGGFSLYNGGWASATNNVYEFQKATKSFSNLGNYKVGDKVKRNYLGFDAQVSLSTALGQSTLRSEYLWGTQPGTASSSVSPKGIQYVKATDIVVIDTFKKSQTVTTSSLIPADAYLRNFSGGYIWFIQRILKTKHELVVKYDWYDPNTDITGNEILNKTSGLADLKFTTLGLGYNYYATANVKFALYYEMISNEKANTAYAFKTSDVNSFTKDFRNDLKDNVITVRVQYKF